MPTKLALDSLAAVAGSVSAPALADEEAAEFSAELELAEPGELELAFVVVVVDATCEPAEIGELEMGPVSLKAS